MLVDLSQQQSSRRQFFGQCLLSLGSLALAHLLRRDQAAAAPSKASARIVHHPARADHVIFLYMAGGPSQLELFDDKPRLRALDGQPAPPSILADQRLAFVQANARLLAPRVRFTRHGQSGATISELLPHLGRVADDITFVRSMHHEVFNHAPAQLYLTSSSSQPGRPCLGSWTLYGLGSPCDNLPGFIVLQSGQRGPDAGANLFSNGFLPTPYQGVRLNNAGAPILYLETPPGISARRQEKTVQALADLNALNARQVGDPDIAARTAAYEMAFRMQSSAPELVDLASEPRRLLDRYGVDTARPSFARNCLLARRLVERGVRFVQLIHKDSDHHGDVGLSLERGLPLVCRETDQPTAALLQDLKERGLLDRTLVVWAGEFGRTPVGESRAFTGRDHHPYAFTLWLAGGGVKAGYSLGETDDLGFQVTENPVSVQDFQATILHLLGLDHLRLTYRFQGRDFRLTDTSGQVVEPLLA